MDAQKKACPRMVYDRAFIRELRKGLEQEKKDIEHMQLHFARLHGGVTEPNQGRFVNRL